MLTLTRRVRIITQRNYEVYCTVEVLRSLGDIEFVWLLQINNEIVLIAYEIVLKTRCFDNYRSLIIFFYCSDNVETGGWWRWQWQQPAAYQEGALRTASYRTRVHARRNGYQSPTVPEQEASSGDISTPKISTIYIGAVLSNLKTNFTVFKQSAVKRLKLICFVMYCCVFVHCRIFGLFFFSEDRTEAPVWSWATGTDRTTREAADTRRCSSVCCQQILESSQWGC